jgi:hypothetical protein
MNPVPFEITDMEGGKVASNGVITLILEEADGRMFKRRAVSGIAMKSPTDVLIPQLNAFQGELLASPDMKPIDAVNRLLAIAGSMPTAEPVKHEWAVVELGDVKVFTDGKHVVVTRRDLQPG